MNINPGFSIPLYQSNEEIFFKESEVNSVLEEMKTLVANDTEEAEELKEVFGSMETIQSMDFSLIMHYERSLLDHIALKSKDIQRFAIGRLKAPQLHLENLFIVKYTLIFPKETLKSLEIPLKQQIDKTYLTIHGKNGLKKIKKKDLFVWCDYLIVSRGYHPFHKRDKLMIEDARFLQKTAREINDLPNLDYWLPPLFSEDQFQGLGIFLKTQKLIVRIHNKYKPGIQSLFDGTIKDNEHKINKKIFVLQGHADELVAKSFLQAEQRNNSNSNKDS